MLRNILVAFALIMFSTTVSATIIDSFSDDQQILVANVGDTGTSFGYGEGILGFERDLIITNHSALFPFYNASIEVNHGMLSFSADSTVTADFIIQWDGIDGSSEINTAGLGSVDLTDGGLNMFVETLTLFADFSYFFEVTTWWNGGLETESVTLLGPGNEDFTHPYKALLPFYVFENTDWSDISALQVHANVAAPEGVVDDFGKIIATGNRVVAFDATLDQIETVSVTEVPEPETAFLFAAGVAGLMLRRKV